MNDINQSTLNFQCTLIESVRRLIKCVSPEWDVKFESQFNLFKKELQELIKQHWPSDTCCLPLPNNPDPQSKYQPLGNGSPIAHGYSSEIYLWQRKSDGNLFIMKHYCTEATYLIENIMIQPHPCLLHFVECFVDDKEKPCVVMEHCNSEKLNWLISKRKDDWFSENDISNWIAQICLAELHINRLEDELKIGIIFDSNDIFLKWGSNGNREVKVRVYPLPSCKNISRIKSMRQSNILSIFAQLLPKDFKNKDEFSGTFLQFSADFHNQKLPTWIEVMGNSIVEKRIEVLKSSSMGTVATHGRFILIASIGRGSYGNVDKMWDREKRETCAIKKMQVVMSSNDTSEIEVLKRCQHENIVNLVDSFMASYGQLWIVMEYCDGGNLHDRIQAQGGGAFNCEQVSFFFFNVLTALQYLHEKTKYFHGDIKPQNILLISSEMSREPRVKLGDFGAAQILSPHQSVMSTFRKIGTPRYMAPEIFHFQPFGKSADLWSLGCLLYEIVALVPAFNYENEEVMIERIKSVQPLPIPSHIPTIVSDQFISLIQGLLSKEPRKRTTLREVSESPCFKNMHDKTVSVVVGFTENRSLWCDGHAPLLESHPGLYPMTLLDAPSSSLSMSVVAKFAFLKQFPQQERTKPALLWLRIRKLDGNWTIEYCTQGQWDYLLNRISITLLYTTSENDGVETSRFREVHKAADGVFFQSVWTPVLTFHNVTTIPAYIQVSLGSECSNIRYESEFQENSILEADFDGVYPTIDCHFRESDRQIWTKLCRHLLENCWLQLSTLRVPWKEQNFTVSFVLFRVHDNLTVKIEFPRECPWFVHLQVYFQITLTNASGVENVLEKSHLADVAQLALQWPNRILCFETAFKSALHPLIPPRVNIRLQLPGEKVKFWWRNHPPITIPPGENEICHEIDINTWEQWLSGAIIWLWLPAIVLGRQEKPLAIVFGLKIYYKRIFMNVHFHLQMPPETFPIQATIKFKINVIWRNNASDFFRVNQSLLIGHRCTTDIEDNVRIPVLRTKMLHAFTSPKAMIRIECHGND